MIERLAIFFVLSVSTLPFISAFECYSCNMDNNDGDHCVDTVETCEPGIESCTMVTYFTNGRTHVRKFCTSAGTPIYQYLLFFPGSALCQNIDTSNENLHFAESSQTENGVDASPPGELVGPPSPQPPAAKPSANPPTLHRAKRVRKAVPGPPAPPRSFSSSLLCVCSTDKCNGGSAQQVLDRLMNNQLPKIPQPFAKKQTDEGLQTLRA